MRSKSVSSTCEVSSIIYLIAALTNRLTGYKIPAIENLGVTRVNILSLTPSDRSQLKHVYLFYRTNMMP